MNKGGLIRNKFGNSHAVLAVAIVAIVAVAGLAMFWQDVKGPSAAPEEWSPVGQAIAISSTLECDDSDSTGETRPYSSVFVAGSVSTRNWSSGVWSAWRTAQNDSCSGSTLTEWYCKTGTTTGYAATNVMCSKGCSGGKCSVTPCEGATKPDVLVASGATGVMLADPAFIGVPPANQTAKSYRDTCIGSTKTREYWCSSGFVSTTVFTCFSGYNCSGGRCVSACADNDRDGYQGSSPSGCTRNTTLDCNDANAAIKPRAAEVCSNGIDEDCSGADLTCPTCNDSDGGDAPTVGGSVTGTWYGGGAYTLADICTSATIVNESICVPPPAGGGMLPSSKSDACAAGQTCIDADGSGSTPAYCG